jgi:hypothetical protein
VPAAPAVLALPRPDGVRALLANTFLHGREGGLAATAFDTVCSLAGEVPVRQLRFAPDPSFWEVIA